MSVFTATQLIDPLYHSGKIIRLEDYSGRTRNKRVEIKILASFRRRQPEERKHGKPVHSSTTDEITAIFTIVRSFMAFVVYRLSAKIIISPNKTKYT